MRAAAAALASLEVGLDVEAQRWPGLRMSGFMPRHIEQPALRHSKPAAVKMRSSPSDSACSFTAIEPGTTMALTERATRLPSTIPAAARRSSIRPFVHDPMNTRSMAMSSIGVPASSAMYRSARSSSALAGSGTRPVTGTTCPGLVPQDTIGASPGTSTVTSVS